MGWRMKNKFRILLFIVCLCGGSKTSAQYSDTLISNRNELVLPSFDSSDASLEKWRDSRDFKYMTYLDSLLRKANLKVDTVRVHKEAGQAMAKSNEKRDSSFLARLFNFRGASLFFWMLAIFFILFIIYKVFIKSGFFLPGLKRRNVFPDTAEDEELQEVHAYDQFISDSERESQFNLATRYYYLKTLKNLKDTELIQYSPDKTNQEYIYELRDVHLRESFRELTRNYEYVWYGEFFLQEDRYQKIKISFEKFNEEVTIRE